MPKGLKFLSTVLHSTHQNDEDVPNEKLRPSGDLARSTERRFLLVGIVEAFLPDVLPSGASIVQLPLLDVGK